MMELSDIVTLVAGLMVGGLGYVMNGLRASALKLEDKLDGIHKILRDNAVDHSDLKERVGRLEAVVSLRRGDA